MTLPGWNALLMKQSLSAPIEAEDEHDYVAKYDAVDIQVHVQEGGCADGDLLSLLQFNRNETVCISSVPEIERRLERAMPSSTDEFATFRVSVTGSSRCFTSQQIEREKAMLQFVFLLGSRVLRGTTPFAEAVRTKLAKGALQDRDPKAAATYAKGPRYYIKSSVETTPEHADAHE